MRETDPQRLAWGVLLLSFAAFCSICVLLVVGVDYFLFQSSVPVEPVLSLGRGSVALTSPSNPLEQVGRSGSVVTAGTVVNTNPQSQGTMLFFDPDHDAAFTSIVLTNSSSATLRNATRPRFDWSRTQHAIGLTNVSGELWVEVTEMDNVQPLVTIQTAQGAMLSLQSAGKYVVEASATELRVYNEQGEAVLIPAGQQQIGHFVPVDGLGAIHYESGEYRGGPGYMNLLADSDLQQLRSGISEPNQPGWTCSNDPGDNPLGQFEFVLTQGRDSLRMFRGDGATSHGRSSCVQSFGQSGLDVLNSGFNYLSLNASLFIAGQSLQVCGFDGSECPFTLRMDYIDAEGEAQNWYHGFYAREAPNFPLRCSGCLFDHDQINELAWYTYESPNLLTLFSPEPPPARIVAIWIYASGHQFDVRISDVSLLTANLDMESDEQP